MPQTPPVTPAWLLVLASLAGGAVSGVLATWITLHFESRRERQRQKLRVLHDFVANRYDLQGEPFTQALNAISTVYYDSRPVLSALSAFHQSVIPPRASEAVVDARLVQLWKEMCSEVGVAKGQLDAEFFMTPFNLRRS